MIKLDKINTSSFILGGAAFSGEGGGYGFGPVEEKQMEKVIFEARENGVAAIDLAPIYGFGEAEKKVGKIIQGQRDQFFLASKSGVSWHSSKRVNMTNDPIIARKMLEQSLKDLKTDYLDAYFIHWPDKNVDIRRPLEVLQKQKDQGKINYIGLCNTNEADLILASEVTEISILQSEYNLFKNGFNEDLKKYILKNNISCWGWGTFDKGIISGSVAEKTKFDSSDCRSWAPWWKKSDKDQKIKKMEKVFAKLPEGKKSGVQLALYYVDQSPFKLNPIIGIKKIDQLKDIFQSYKNRYELDKIYPEIMEKFFNDGK